MRLGWSVAVLRRLPRQRFSIMLRLARLARVAALARGLRTSTAMQADLNIYFGSQTGTGESRRVSPIASIAAAVLDLPFVVVAIVSE